MASELAGEAYNKSIFIFLNYTENVFLASHDLMLFIYVAVG